MRKSKKIHVSLARMKVKDVEEKSKGGGPKEVEKPQNVPVVKRKTRKVQWNLAGVEVRGSEIRGLSMLNREHGEQLLGLQKQEAFRLGLQR